MSILEVTGLEISQIHGNESWLLFLDIKVFYISALFKILEGERGVHDILYRYFEFVVFDCEEGAHTSAWVCIYFDLVLNDISDYGDFVWNISSSPWSLEYGDDAGSAFSKGHPVAIDHDLGLGMEIVLHQILV